MHILIGALVGGAFAAVTIVAVALVMGRKITAKNLLLGVLGGAIAGAVTTATLGASSLVGVGAARQVGAFALGGAAGGAAERAADNAVEGRPLQDGVVKATAIGGGVGVASLGVLKGSSLTLGRVAPALTRPGSGYVSRLLTAPVPGTGGGSVRTFNAPDRDADVDSNVDVDSNIISPDSPVAPDSYGEPDADEGFGSASPRGPPEPEAPVQTRDQKGMAGRLSF